MVATEDGPMRILVIEDEARIRSFLARGLEAEGYSVEGAADGRAGLARALGPSWDLVVLDLLLPGLGGLDVLRELHRERPALPVLVLSARSDLPTKLRGFELGADYLPSRSRSPSCSRACGFSSGRPRPLTRAEISSAADA